MEQQSFTHRLLSVNGIQTHLTEAGNNKKQPILFLHGYPENWKEYEKVMTLLKDEYHVLAIDLPGIGTSAPIGESDKLSVARFVRDLLQILNLKDIILVGHDIGGMITYSFVKHFSGFLSKAVIICTAIPGVHPWEEVKRNPFIWHFAFFLSPNCLSYLLKENTRYCSNIFIIPYPLIRLLLIKRTKEPISKRIIPNTALKRDWNGTGHFLSMKKKIRKMLL